MMASQIVKVKRDKLAACMACPLCNKLFRDATTISECLHTFCRKCIYEKITDEELNHCPVCNIDLGCAPLEKLRADHNVQDLKAKLFPTGRKKIKSPEAVPSVPLPGKRKERSLSSLGFSATRLSAPPGLIGKRIKSAARKFLVLQESTLFVDDPFNREEDDKEVEDCVNSSNAESSKQHMSNKPTVDNAEPCEGKNDLWKPLNRLVETASKTNKSVKFKMHGTTMLPDANEARVPKFKIKGRGNKSKGHGHENSSAPASSSVKPKKLQAVRQRRAAVSDIPGQAALDANSKRDRIFSPLWFSLVASDKQVGDAPLPQISSCYLRVKDGSLPVSLIKEYLVKKLDLASEAEVEILLQGQPLISTQQLHDLVDMWLQTKPTSERIQTSVGSSAKDFVMVLSYGRSA
ncbi:E3 ubiquitin protein ligase DRIP2-like [Alnus glutinosa]|uniref:E3 ubiquitin protein ligase DRIP2-like n=1 Tax=Alnus glutinosa TaxID=3517 RepID=UPI002D797509|nr:E3 ubiquitin protein ligase DRIP2-like [Alnus glutinosa]